MRKPSEATLTEIQDYLQIIEKRIADALSHMYIALPRQVSIHSINISTMEVTEKGQDGKSYIPSSVNVDVFVNLDDVDGVGI